MSYRPDLPIELLRIEDLTPSAKNPRTHNRKQIAKIVKSIQTFGFTNPVLVDEDSRILAGHGRVAAMKKMDEKHVPCRRLIGLSEAEKRAYVIADNKLALDAGWDTEDLGSELAALSEQGFEIELTGFDEIEFDLLMANRSASSTKSNDAEDEIPARRSASEAVTREGDSWQMGRHRLICGDAKDPAVLASLMGNELADMIFTDPPYNVPIYGHVSTKGARGHREFVEASGEMSSAEFEGFLALTLGNASAVCRDGAIVYVCMDWRHMEEILQAGSRVFSELKNLCVWAKTNGGMGSFYRSKHELVFVWKKGDAAHINTFGLGDKGRYRTNVWEYAGVNAFGAERDGELEMHPTVKPVAMVMDAIRDVTHRRHVVLDVFGGSGTTMIATEKTGRVAYLLELDPSYCDVIVRRFEKLTGQAATLLGTELTFEDVNSQRAAANTDRTEQEDAA